MAEIIDKEYFITLLIKASEGALSPQETDTLNRCIQNDDGCAQLYVDFFDTLSGLMDIGEHSFAPNESGSLNTNILMSMLAEEEKSSPAVEVFKAAPKPELIQKVVYEKSRRPVNKTFLFVTFSALAAMLLMVVFLKLNPPVQTELVATVRGSLSAQFADHTAIETGSRISNRRESYVLQSGYLELEFDYGAILVVEAPAVFEIQSPEKIRMDTGRIFARVPGSARGFTVETPNSTIIDLGTEFGVQVDPEISSVHMVKGRATLIPGPKKQTREFQILNPDQARSTNHQGQVRTIPFEKYLFARRIDAQTGVVWKGHTTADLASLIAGGNGLAPVEGMCSIDPLTGKKGTVRGKSRHSNQRYSPSEANPYIDGLFIPAGGNTIVSSTGHAFQCPQTEGHFTQNILVFYGKDAAETENRQSTIAGNSQYGIQDTPYILMHSNIGITLDLARIKQAVGIVDPETCSFKTAAGMSMMHDSKTTHVNFYVLVDGVIQFEKTGFSPADGLIEIEVPLNTRGRFLSLIVTDCMENNPLKGQACSSDFFYLIGPTLDWQL